MSAFSTGLLGEETKAFWISAAVAVCWLLPQQIVHFVAQFSASIYGIPLR